MSHPVYIAIGSNLGDRYANLQTALAGLGRLEATRLKRCSSVYESEPHGRARNWFLNGAVEISTELDPGTLLGELQALETSMGRKRGGASISRTIDLDILFYDGRIIDQPELVVPHPRLYERRFVLLPMSEMAPDLVHPVCGRTVSALLAATDDAKRVRLYEP